MTTAETLEGLLSRGYAAIAMGRGDINQVIADFADAAEEDGELESTAELTFRALTAVQNQRCFICKTRAEFLRRAMNL